VEANYGVFWPCPSEDHPGTPRLFEPASLNPVAKGAGPFYFPDGKARFLVTPYAPPAEVPSANSLEPFIPSSHYANGEE
jgi:assimilatory nitrate reductase catalytic subunit